MGEAKKRGSAAERQAEARERTLKDIEQARKDQALPENAKFCGFVVHVPETDDYLANITDTEIATRRAYAKSPEFAIRYQDPLRAKATADGLPKRAIVGIMFDVDNRLLVAFKEK